MYLDKSPHPAKLISTMNLFSKRLPVIKEENASTANSNADSPKQAYEKPKAKSAISFGFHFEASFFIYVSQEGRTWLRLAFPAIPALCELALDFLAT